MTRLTVLLLLGGESSEHDVSIMSARNVYAAMDGEKYKTLLCYIDRNGKWWLLDEWTDNLSRHGGVQLLAAPGTGSFMTIPGNTVVRADVVLAGVRIEATGPVVCVTPAGAAARIFVGNAGAAAPVAVGSRVGSVVEVGAEGIGVLISWNICRYCGAVAARAMFSAQQKASATLYRKFFGPKTAQTVGAP